MPQKKVHTPSRQPGRPKKNKAQHPVRSIRDIDPSIFFDFTAFAKKRGDTVGEALTSLMRQRLKEVEQEYLELRAENIRGR